MDKQLYAVPSCLFAGFLCGDEARQQIRQRIWAYLIHKRAETGSDEAIRQALAKLGLKCAQGGNPRTIYEEGKKIAERLTTRSFFMINLVKLSDIVDGEHTDIYVRDWLAYEAIRSIEGKRPYVKTCNLIWLARMDGRDTASSPEELSEEIRAVSGRKMMDAMKERLYTNYGVLTDGHRMRGYIATTKLTPKELAERIGGLKQERNSKLAVARRELEEHLKGNI